MESIEESEARRFFGMIFPDEILAEHWLTLWILSAGETKVSSTHRFRTGREAARVVSERRSDHVYFGLGLMKHPPIRGRGAEADVSMLTSLYLDIDVADGQVKRGKRGLPSSKGEALKIVEGMRLPPSILVDSGHGFQAYWLIRGGIRIESDEDRKSAKTLSKAWNSTARLVAKDLGFPEMDSTFDLARVFRTPGSYNVKGEPRRCFVKESGEGESLRFYDREELERACAPAPLWPDGPAFARRAIISPAAAVLPRDVGMSDRLSTFIENDSDIRNIWNKAKPLAGPAGDQSPSAWDLAVATRLASAQFSHQEIADALLLFRKKHGADLSKLARRDYVMTTISKAATYASRSVATEAILEIADECASSTAVPPEASIGEGTLDEDGNVVAPEDAESGAPVADGALSAKGYMPEDRRDEILTKLSSVFGVAIARVCKHGDERAMFSMVLENGTDVGLGSIDSVLNQDRMRARIADASGIIFSEMKRPVWFKVVQVLLRVAERVVNREASRVEKIEMWVGDYVSHHTALHRGDNWGEALVANDPFLRTTEEGTFLHIHAPSLLRFVKAVTGDRIADSELHDMLRVGGFESVAVSARVNGRNVCRSYWRRERTGKGDKPEEGAGDGSEE